MAITPFFRKLNLTAHIAFSVGWFGAVAGFLALAIAGLTSRNPQIVRGSYIAMELISRFAILPACFLSLLTGVVQSLGTQWGLFRYYWIIVKLTLTVLSTIILLIHMKPISYLGEQALVHVISQDEHRGLRIQLIADAGAALLVLLVTISLSVYKPWGRISYSNTAFYDRNIKLSHASNLGNRRTRYLLIALIIVVIFMFIILHLTKEGFRH